MAHQSFAETYTPELGYHTQSQCYYGRVAGTFGKDLPKIRQGKILDIGCSKGWTTIELANLYQDTCIIGIDIQSWSIVDALQSMDQARKEGRVEELHSILHGNRLAYKPGLKMPDHFLAADGFYPPFKAETFQAVFCMNNIHYAIPRIEESLAAKRLNQIARLVKPGGFLLISGFGPDFENDYIILKKLTQDFQQHKISDIKNEESKRCLEIILNSLLKKS